MIKVRETQKGLPATPGFVIVSGRPDVGEKRLYEVMPDAGCSLCYGSGHVLIVDMGRSRRRQCDCVIRRLQHFLREGKATINKADQPAAEVTAPADQTDSSAAERLEAGRRQVEGLMKQRENALQPLRSQRQQLLAEHEAAMQRVARKQNDADELDAQAYLMELQVQELRAKVEQRIRTAKELRLESKADEAHAVELEKQFSNLGDELTAIDRRWEKRLSGPRHRLERMEARARREQPQEEQQA